MCRNVSSNNKFFFPHLVEAGPEAILQLYSLSWAMSPLDTHLFTCARSESLNLTREPCPQASPQDFWLRNMGSCTLGHSALSGLCFSWILYLPFPLWLHIVNHFLSSKSTHEEAFQAFPAKTTHYDNFCSTVIYIISCSIRYSNHNIVKWIKILPTLATIRSSHNFISIDSLHIQTN